MSHRSMIIGCAYNEYIRADNGRCDNWQVLVLDKHVSSRSNSRHDSVKLRVSFVFWAREYCWEKRRERKSIITCVIDCSYPTIQQACVTSLTQRGRVGETTKAKTCANNVGYRRRTMITSLYPRLAKRSGLFGLQYSLRKS